MDIQTIYLSTVFTAGILSFFSPCIIPLLPVYFSVFASNAARDNSKGTRWRVLFKSLLFVAGLSTNFVILGFGAGALGAIINVRPFMIVIGLIVILLGLHQTGLIKIPVLMRQKTMEFKRSQKRDALGVFLLGFAFSFGWTPCIGPILGAILGLAASGSQAGYGGLLMAVFSLGFLIPFLILALFSDLLLKKIHFLNKHLNRIKIIGGILVILMGLLLMTDNLNTITAPLNSTVKTTSTTIAPKVIKEKKENTMKAPDFEMKDLKGNTVKLSDFSGENVYIKYWASWCPICLGGLEDINTLYGEDTDFQVLTIVSPNHKGEMNAEDFKVWFSDVENTENITVLLDEDGIYSTAAGVRGYPTSEWINKEQMILNITPGHQNNDMIKAGFSEKNLQKEGMDDTMKKSENTKEIYLAGGCFWGIEAYLKKLPGVLDTDVGYANGNTENPTYEEVCRKKTGHAETVRVSYDSDVLDLDTLLQAYFKVIDPTSKNRQGNDRGSQYRSGIYSSDGADTETINNAILLEQKKYTKPIVTEVVPLDRYYSAEDYHQDYLDKNPNGYCHIDLNEADTFIEENSLDTPDLNTLIQAENYKIPSDETLKKTLTWDTFLKTAQKNPAVYAIALTAHPSALFQKKT